MDAQQRIKLPPGRGASAVFRNSNGGHSTVDGAGTRGNPQSARYCTVGSGHGAAPTCNAHCSMPLHFCEFGNPTPRLFSTPLFIQHMYLQKAYLFGRLWPRQQTKQGRTSVLCFLGGRAPIQLSNVSRSVYYLGKMVGLKPAATVASAGALYLLASSIFRRKMLARHGVATTLVKYARLRFLMMRSGGWKSMLVLADFDRTITTASCGTSCHGVVESCQELSAEYRAKTQVLFDKYFPIETNPTMGREEKIPLMQEWSAPSDDLSWHSFHF